LSTAWIAITGTYSSSGRSTRAQRAPAGKDTPATSGQPISLSVNTLRTEMPADPTRNRGLVNSSTQPARMTPRIAMATWSAVWKMTPVDPILSSAPTAMCTTTITAAAV